MTNDKKTLKIIIVYGIFSLLWIIIPKKVLGSFSNSVEMIFKLDQYIEYMYIVLSASFLYFIINNLEIEYISIIKNMKSKNIIIQQELQIVSRKLDLNEYTKKELEEYANIDELTGIYNRRSGIDFIKKQMNQVLSNEDTMLIAFIDIDNLKMVNDIFGHIEGDNLIISAAKILKNSLAKSDIVCRYGGDEFLIALAGASAKDIQSINARLETAISNYNTYSLKDYSISLSIGFSEFNNNISKSIEELIIEADKNMYISKRSKKLQEVKSYNLSAHLVG